MECYGEETRAKRTELVWTLLKLIWSAGIREKGWKLSFSKKPPIIFMSKEHRAIIIYVEERKILFRLGWLGEYEGIHGTARLEDLKEFFNR